MLDTITITNKDGATFYQVNDVKSPLTAFDVTVQRRVDSSRNRSQNHGVNPTISLKGGMEIHMEGALFDDNSSLYVIQRRALITAVEGDPNVAPTPGIRYDLTITFTPAGETEAWQTNCIVSEFTSPVRALYPALTEYALTLFSWTPWFVGVDTATRYYWT